MFTKIYNAMETKDMSWKKNTQLSKRHVSYTKTNNYVSCIYIQFLGFLKTQTLYFSLIQHFPWRNLYIFARNDHISLAHVYLV